MKWLKYSLVVLVFIVLLAYVSLKSMVLTPPEIKDRSALDYPVKKIDSVTTVCHNSWLHKNYGGINELYVTGDPFTMGVTNGKLTRQLAADQENAFIKFIKGMVPSETVLNYLRYFITIFNKDLDKYIPLEYRQEIYGVSLFAADEYDFVGDKYHRILNYHAAHDIGHTIQNMNLVNCTAFGVQNEYTSDSSLYVGRNLDFSAGDDFARNKIVVFCKPDKGYRFAFISWGGMIGVISGMNEYGLTITLNSAKSGIPFSAKAPVSLVARDVLQHAKNIEETFEILQKYETFVSESFFVSSAIDNKAVVIEKSQDTTAIYDSEISKLVLTNHFQSKELADSPLNLQAVEEGCSLYRLKRTHELINNSRPLDQNGMARILRDKYGLNSDSIGIGNEMALDQLICHHSVIFNPSKRLMWVSEFPYQENAYLAYDLNVVFSDTFNIYKQPVTVDSLLIEPSEFYKNGGVDQIWEYRSKLEAIKEYIYQDKAMAFRPESFDNILALNPRFFYGYYIVALYYIKVEQKDEALLYLNKCMQCEFPRKVDREQVVKKLVEINGKR